MDGEVHFQFGLPEFGILALTLFLIYGISWAWKLAAINRKKANTRTRVAREADAAGDLPDDDASDEDAAAEDAGDEVAGSGGDAGEDEDEDEDEDEESSF